MSSQSNPGPWFILQVASGREEAVRRRLAAKLAAAGLEPIVPCLVVLRERTVRFDGGARRTVERPVYPGYVLARVEVDADGAVPPAVLDVVRAERAKFLGAPGAPDRPAPLGVGEAAQVEARLARLGEAEETAVVELRWGDRVRLRGGPLDGFEGTVEEVVPERGLVRVLVAVFGRLTPVEVEATRLERLTA